MIARHSTPKPKGKSKPAKPHPDFPLTAHNSGKWVKKIRGKQYYFGRWDDPQSAMDDYMAVRDDLMAGRRPRRQSGEPTVADGCNRFLEAYEKLTKAKGYTIRNFNEKQESLRMFCEVVGRDRVLVDLQSNDFMDFLVHVAGKYGKARQSKFIGHVIHWSRWLVAEGVVEHPLKMGMDFKRPSESEMIGERNAKGQRFFEAETIRRLLPKLDEHMKAFVLLSLNCGLGNGDIALMEPEHLDLNNGWYRANVRGKNKAARRSSLWPETIEAVHAALAKQPEHEHETLFITTRTKKPWGERDASAPAGGFISSMFYRAMTRAGLHRPNQSFYVLRSTYRTVVDECTDYPAIDLTMGHVSKSMGNRRYVDHLPNEQVRLRAIAEHMRKWLLGDLGRTIQDVGERSESAQ